MGYYANGSGTIHLTEMSDEIRSIIAEAFEFDITQPEEGGYDVSVWASDKYYEPEVGEALNKLAPYTKEGWIQYIGEDEEIWRWKFDAKTKTWEDETADIVYWSDIEIDEIPEDARKRLLGMRT